MSPRLVCVVHVFTWHSWRQVDRLGLFCLCGGAGVGWEEVGVFAKEYEHAEESSTLTVHTSLTLAFHAAKSVQETRLSI